jgi:hypothetical protein
VRPLERILAHADESPMNSEGASASFLAHLCFLLRSSLDFSHSGMRQSASAKVSMNTPETFLGSLAHTDPKKVSDR